ncbi:hypothetical protein HDE68_004049 [Pedobacter cryoconitis]|uniref:Lipocalin-like domain-containing protein n=1 Tax=Pedobacter cryoconitis TaxID=188932 RepID=A0A7W9E0M7_9SPHI|nr:hypothetical protein [Pedobacter cryoconitis]MBB5638123.1 hypothetical protein [Pedobacter cryoconitis]
MKIKFLVLLLAGATSLAACKKDKDAPAPNPGDTQLPIGTYKLVQSINYDSTGKADTLKFPLSDLSLSFDQAKQTANIAGKPESIQITGGYNVKANNVLTDAVFTTPGIAPPTANDAVVLNLLKTGDSYEAKGATVTIKAKDKGFLVFSAQK